MRFNPITAFAVASVISVQSAEAWSIQFQDYSAQTPEYSEKLTNMKDNFCYNMNDLDTANPWNDRVDRAWIWDAICVFWADYGCSGHHTKTETGAAGTHLVDFAGVCKTGFTEWRNRISSFRCCSGTTWCDGGSPGCT